MPIKSYKPTTPSRRFITNVDNSSLTKKQSAPEKSLSAKKTRKVGRNKNNTITIHHRGGGHKRKYRVIEFAQHHLGLQGEVKSVEYDPNRSSRISLVVFENGEKAYMLTPKGVKVGDKVRCDDKPVDIKAGNRTTLANIPEGVLIHNVELQPGRGGQMARSAGSSVKLVGHEGKYALLQLPSSEVRRVVETCFATIGEVGNADHNNQVIGKAGRKRWMGRRPQVRGSAKNPVDHPHGGGEGNQSIGLKHPKTPWGLPALGYKTRRKKQSDKDIIRRRKK